jgi:hypothetical protein
LHEDSNGHSVREVNFATSGRIVVKSTMFPHRNIRNYTWTSADGKTHNQIYHVLINTRWYSSKLDLRSFKRADYDIDHYLVTVKVREMLSVRKQAVQKLMLKDSILRS